MSSIAMPSGLQVHKQVKYGGLDVHQGCCWFIGNEQARAAGSAIAIMTLYCMPPLSWWIGRKAGGRVEMPPSAAAVSSSCEN